MANPTTTGQSGADEAARRAAEQRAAEERAKQRAYIQGQIQSWNNKLSDVNSQISGLTAEQSNLDTYLGDWETQKNIYSGSEILSEVVIVNTFEGICADKSKHKFEAAIKEMDQTYIDVSQMSGHVGAQIARLNQYVSKINTKLADLKNQLMQYS